MTEPKKLLTAKESAEKAGTTPSRLRQLPGKEFNRTGITEEQLP